MLIRTIRQVVRQAHGAFTPRYVDVATELTCCASKRLMRENAIRARHKRRKKATPDSKHRRPVAPNVRDCHFAPDVLNSVWMGDITYIATAEGWLYLTVVIDLFNREVVGWSIKPRMMTDLVLALSMAWFRHRPEPGGLFHSDRGSQYSRHACKARLATSGMCGSLSRKGNCWDNARTESFSNSLKNERVHGVCYATRNEGTSDLFQYIAVFYNRNRRHSALGYFFSDYVPEELDRTTESAKNGRTSSFRAPIFSMFDPY